MKQRLELIWVGKEDRPRLEPRILLEDPELSYTSKVRVSESDIFDNRLIFGDNLLALKALEQEFSEKIKCIYIDPPFNTGEMFEHYDDGVEHSIWLSQMHARLTILHKLLAPSGTLFVHIDDNELGYLTVMVDELFGRHNRLYTVTFKQGSATGHKAINPGCVSTTNFLLIYAKDKSSWRPNRVYTARGRDTRYAQFIDNVGDHESLWQFETLTSAFARENELSERSARAAIRKDPDLLDKFVIKHASKVVRTARPDYEAVSEAAQLMIDRSRKEPDVVLRLSRNNAPDMLFRNGERIIFYSDKLRLVDGEYVAGEPLTTLWDDILSNNLHKEGGVDFPKGKKPEALIKRTLELATEENDFVLDSFAGSGTTGAVAHKMRRKWILVELRETCYTHILPRLRRVIDGSDQSGVTASVNWKGGGGFRFCRLAPSLLQEDRWGRWVINDAYNPEMLAEAICKLEGYRYDPSDAVYWRHGQSTERAFIYVTTQAMTHEQLLDLSDEVGHDRALLVSAMAFHGARPGDYPNLTLKKIPQQVLNRCEWGKDDYSLKVENLPMAAKAPPTSLFEEDGDLV